MKPVLEKVEKIYLRKGIMKPIIENVDKIVSKC